MSDWLDLNPDPIHVRRERERARELRRTDWWRAQIAKGECHYCHRIVGAENLTLDHVIPVARGGRSTRGNCVPCCADCNAKKKAYTPAEQILAKLFPDKAEIRKEMRARRRTLAPEERARAARVVCGKILSDEFSHAAADLFDGRGALAVYLASPDEIDLSEAIKAMLESGATVVAPRWNGEAYELAKLKSLREENLRKGPMGILEPKDSEVVPPQEVSVWLVPGLAFTRGGKRLGYGGGWYDRLLANAAPNARKLGVAHGFQVLDDLPTEPYDILLDDVVVANPLPTTP